VFGPNRAEPCSVIQIALVAICVGAIVFLLRFLKALLEDSRRHSRGPTEIGAKLEVLAPPRGREPRSQTTGSR
jgi:hypothetical protein